LIRTCRRAALALALLATPVAAAGPYAPPEPDVLSTLERHHSRHDWWRITLDSTRWEVRVRTVDASGLSGFQPRKKGAPVPGAIPWSEISRIDERKSHFRKKQVEGVIIGGIAAPTLAALGGLQDPLPVFALFAGAGLGGWLGGLYGDSQVHEQPVYISRTLLVAPPALAAAVSDPSADSVSTAAALDSTRAVATGLVTLAPASGAATTDPTAIAPGEPDPDVVEACRVIHPSSVVRVHADFGLFEGNVEHAGNAGLSGLRLASDNGPAARAMPDLVRWERIQRVELRGNHAREGAIAGAIVGCGLGALVGLAAAVAIAEGGSSTDGGGTWILAGAAAGAGGCALVGAGFGSLGTKWKPIYAR